MLTMKGKYGLKAMLHLAGCPGGEPQGSMEIALKNGMSKKFLDAILADLRVGGLIVSKKGKSGGYALARPAHEISVASIIRILDGPLAPIDCASRTRYRRCADCVDETQCSIRRMMQEVRDSTARILDNCSLAEMRASVDWHEDALSFQI